jgi:hypothetical protein
MNSWKDGYEELKVVLEKTGWKSITHEALETENWYSQGVLYANFLKNGKVIHIEYGDEDSILQK